MRSAIVVNGQNGLAQQFDNLRHDARGGANLLAHQMLGYLALPDAPTNSQTITLDINGNNIVLTAVGTIGTSAGNVLNPGTAAGFAANVLALLQQPQTTTANGVALSTANQQFLSYLAFSLVGTTIYVSSNNNSLYGPLSSFSASTTVSSASWTAQTMQLYVEPGVVYVGGTRVIFSGSSTPTVTAPSSNPRIDVLTVDNTGTLAWTTGTEASSPSAPAYPADKIALCELYNVVSETALYDLENQQSGAGYVYHDVRPILGLPFNPGAIPDSLVPTSNNTLNLGSSGDQWNVVYASSFLQNGAAIAVSKFGGTGTDGSLSVSSGTTTISMANNSYFEKNYTAVSITGTGAIAFSNPSSTAGTAIALRSQGNVTITSSASPAIDVRNCGGGVGNGSQAISTGSQTNGAGGGGGGSTIGFGTQGGSLTSFIGGFGGLIVPTISPLMRLALPGGNGAVGGTGTSGNIGGAGGLGAGGLYIECAGAYECTGSINASAANGSVGAYDGTHGGGGGGGGGGGNILIIYASLTADTGTYTISAGSGAASGGGVGGAGGNGASGSLLRTYNNYFS